MNFTPSGPVLIAGAGCQLARILAHALQEEEIQVLGCCTSEGGLTACRDEGIPAILLDTPDTLAERAVQELGQVPTAYVDFMHSRFERLTASATPDEISRWAATDIALRARTLRSITRAMLGRRQGRCLFISSAAAEAPAPGQGYYAAAKLAGEALFASTGIELASRGITTCSLRLSWMKIGRGQEFLQEHEIQASTRMPTKTLVTPQEAVAGMMYLLSPQAHSINARTLTIDGGLAATKTTL